MTRTAWGPNLASLAPASRFLQDCWHLRNWSQDCATQSQWLTQPMEWSPQDGAVLSPNPWGSTLKKRKGHDQMGFVKLFQKWSQVHCSFSTPGEKSKKLKLKVAHIFFLQSLSLSSSWEVSEIQFLSNFCKLLSICLHGLLQGSRESTGSGSWIIFL